MEGDVVTDILIQKNHEPFTINHPRINTKNTHGTGCTLASAIACNLALGQNLQLAVQNATNYVHNAILTAPNLGKGHGPLNHWL